MKRFFVITGVLLAICLLLSGCGSSEETFLMRSRERNFLKSEFDENYTHYEDDLEVEKRASEIHITGNTTSGTIDLKLIENDKDGNAAQIFEYQITDVLNETLELNKSHSENWVIVVDISKDTEGYFKVEVYG